MVRRGWPERSALPLFQPGRQSHDGCPRHDCEYQTLRASPADASHRDPATDRRDAAGRSTGEGRVAPTRSSSSRNHAHRSPRREIAATNLTEDASLDELREMACHLRALSSDSALADVVDTRIAMILAARAREQAARDGWGK